MKTLGIWLRGNAGKGNREWTPMNANEGIATDGSRLRLRLDFPMVLLSMVL